MKAEVVAMDAEHLNMEAIQKAGKILETTHHHLRGMQQWQGRL